MKISQRIEKELKKELNQKRVNDVLKEIAKWISLASFDSKRIVQIRDNSRLVVNSFNQLT
jgi:hypothetical protein